MIVLIDNGHGYDTAGKCSPDKKYKEYKYARLVANMIRYNLVQKGINARQIVTESIDIPLQERCNRVNKICDAVGKENVLLVSIHSNAAGAGQWMNARGWSAYTTPGKTASDSLAEKLYASAEKHLAKYAQTFTEADKKRGQKSLRKDLTDGDSVMESNFYILKHTKCAAVLTENLFHDNKDDVAFLDSKEGFDAIVALHVDGIMDYINGK